MSTGALFGAGAIPLITAIVQVFKSTGVPARWAPAVALALGLAAGLISVWPSQPSPVDWGPGVILGVTWGLAASGLYAGGKLARVALTAQPSPYAPPGSKAAPAIHAGASKASPSVGAPSELAAHDSSVTVVASSDHPAQVPAVSVPTSADHPAQALPASVAASSEHPADASSPSAESPSPSMTAPR